jgi:hypothetical protein
VVRHKRAVEPTSRRARLESDTASDADATPNRHARSDAEPGTVHRLPLEQRLEP